MRMLNVKRLALFAVLALSAFAAAERTCTEMEYHGRTVRKCREAGSLTDSRDGRTYRTVKIGDQTWMAENLNYNYDVGTASSFCYGGEADSCAKYGRLYTWSAAMDSAAVFSEGGKGCGYGRSCEPTYPVRGACPEGWHLPGRTEFERLVAAVGGEDVAGKALKSTSGWKSDGNGMDAYGFFALPAGNRSYDGDFFSAGYFANFWSATEYASLYAYYLSMYYGYEFAYLNYVYEYYAFSVRCLKDSD